MANTQVFNGPARGLLLCLLAQFFLFGCSGIRNYSPKSGNPLSDRKASGPLKKGMTDSEVRKAIGVLFRDGSCGTLRWDYYECISMRYPFSRVGLYFELDENGVYRLHDWKIGVKSGATIGPILHLKDPQISKADLSLPPS